MFILSTIQVKNLFCHVLRIHLQMLANRLHLKTFFTFYSLTFSIGIAFLLFSFTVSGQPYFKRVEGSDKFFRQRIASFQNGDVIICDSSIEAQRTGEGGQITMTRLDECGNLIWAKAYNRTPEYLEFKDIKVNSSDEIFAYGSAYIGLNELIFLLKISPEGNLLQFRMFRPETVDHFSYAIELKNGQLMLYGLLLDFGTQKQGFVAVFDERLNFVWGKKFAPFDSDGNAIFTKDGGFLCHAGAYLYKLNARGDIEWSKSIATNSGLKLLAGPLEIDNGYVFQGYLNGFSTLYNISAQEDLIWSSRAFPSTAVEAGMTLTAQQQILVVYNSKEGDDSKLAYLLVQQNGTILEQRYLQHTSNTLEMSSIYATITENDVVQIAGNKNAFQREAFNFLIQFPLSTPIPSDCFQWESMNTSAPNNMNLSLQVLDTVAVATNMSKSDSENLVTTNFKPPFLDYCNTNTFNTLTELDSTLACGDNWLVNLPPGFIWEDRNRDNPRLLTQVGTYRAINNQDCTAPIVQSYQLQRVACNCTVYLPTAFSPNLDNQNEQFQLFSNCTIQTLDLSVYNRWGSKIFRQQGVPTPWDGKIDGKFAPPGVYLIKVQYELTDDTGEVQTGHLVQQLVVLE